MAWIAAASAAAAASLFSLVRRSLIIFCMRCMWLRCFACRSLGLGLGLWIGLGPGLGLGSGSGLG